MMKRGLLSLAVLGALAGGAGLTYAQPTIRPTVSMRKRRGLFNGALIPTWDHTAHRGAGITMAQQKRNSQKKRNRARHKAASKG